MQAFVDLVAIAQNEVDVATSGAALLDGKRQYELQGRHGLRKSGRQGAVPGGSEGRGQQASTRTLFITA
jgi:hypothetical protein